MFHNPKLKLLLPWEGLLSLDSDVDSSLAFRLHERDMSVSSSVLMHTELGSLRRFLDKPCSCLDIALTLPLDSVVDV